MHDSDDQNKLWLNCVENSVGKHFRQAAMNTFFYYSPTCWCFRNFENGVFNRLNEA
jgi:hypothetical protein